MSQIYKSAHEFDYWAGHKFDLDFIITIYRTHKGLRLYFSNRLMSLTTKISHEAITRFGFDVKIISYNTTISIFIFYNYS